VTITVIPEQFTYVSYDAGEISRIAAQMMDTLELAGRDVEIEVDETTPLSRIRVRFDDRSISIRVESGAFEDLRHLRQPDEIRTATSIGRLLLRVKDRTSGAFAAAPPDDEMTLAQMAAWDAYCVARLAKLGIAVNQQRWRYNFRNRHGFTDAVDDAFDQLWNADDLNWDDLQRISTAAATA
jgi:hypothetical protein